MADQTVQTREIGIDALIDQIDGEELHKPNPAYEFSNGRVFNDPGEEGSLYSGE